MPPTKPAKNPDRLRREIVVQLEDFPRQLELLEAGMEAFGEDFDLKPFKLAFDGKAGIDRSLQVQAVERSFTRIQNYIAQLAQNGARLAGLDLPKIHTGAAARSFEALKAAGVIDARTCRRLKQTQETRSAIEHEYLQMNAGRLHTAIALLAETARDFIVPFAAWIEPNLS